MSGRYLARKIGQAILTIFAIVLLNFLLFRMMPGSPERVLLRNPYLTQEKIAAGPQGVGPRQAARPGPARRLRQGDGRRRPRLLAQVPRPVGRRGHGAAASGRRSSSSGSPRSSRSSSASRLGAYAGWRRGGTGDRVGSGAEPDPLLDAVLRHRHAADHHLRGDPRLVPDVGDAHARGAVRVVPRAARATSSATSSCR